MIPSPSFLARVPRVWTASLPSTTTTTGVHCRRKRETLDQPDARGAMGCGGNTRLHAWKVLPSNRPRATRPPLAPGILVRILNLAEWRRCNEHTEPTQRTSYPPRRRTTPGNGPRSREPNNPPAPSHQVKHGEHEAWLPCFSRICLLEILVFRGERVWKWVGDDLFGESCWMMNLLIESFVDVREESIFSSFFFSLIVFERRCCEKGRNEY